MQYFKYCLLQFLTMRRSTYIPGFVALGIVSTFCFGLLFGILKALVGFDLSVLSSLLAADVMALTYVAKFKKPINIKESVLITGVWSGFLLLNMGISTTIFYHSGMYMSFEHLMFHIVVNFGSLLVKAFFIALTLIYVSKFTKCKHGRFISFTKSIFKTEQRTLIFAIVVFLFSILLVIGSSILAGYFISSPPGHL